MNPAAQVPVPTHPNWRDLVEAVTLETDGTNWSQRIKDAQDAVMDEIEDSFCTASSAERQALINAIVGSTSNVRLR